MQPHADSPSAGDASATPEMNALTPGVRPAWQILDEARERRFTGEVVFELETPVIAYFDAGVVYVAERVDEPPLGDRLVDAGVVESDDLRRGAVRVGRVEHLGRLFERLPDLDRDAVIVTLELATESLISELANTVNCDIRYTAYRHHPAGVHRWYAGPRAFTSHAEFAPTPGSERTMIEDLSALPLAPDGSAGQLYIEWDEPILGLDGSGLDAASLHLSDHEIASDLRQDVRGVEDWTQQVDAADELVLFDDPVLDDDDERSPDHRAAGEKEPLLGAGDVIDDELDDLDDLSGAVDVITDAESDPASDQVLAEWTRLPMPDPQQLVSTQPPVVETDGVNFRIELPFMSDDGGAEAAAVDSPQADVVADAVRRALSAIEQATIEWDNGSEGAADHANGDRPPDVAEELPSRWDPEPAPDTIAGPISGGSPFAPPTLDMSAEAIYARSEEAAGVAERTSALRRLIGGLRRK